MQLRETWYTTIIIPDHAITPGKHQTSQTDKKNSVIVDKSSLFGCSSLKL